MSYIYLDIKHTAAALGGDVSSPVNAVVPGLGHSSSDRSLSIKLVPTTSYGFIVHSFANDDFWSCRDYVLAAIGKLPVQHVGEVSAA
jgi:hypothetical protein